MSLAFPKLRRTLTDVMEDELYDDQVTETSPYQYYDVPEILPNDFNVKRIFNEFADPNLTTTNNSFFYQSNDDLTNSESQEKFLKFNDDLSLDYFNNSDSLLIFANNNSPNLIPEEDIEEELSDDEMNDTLDDLDDDGIAGNSNLDIESDVDKMSLISDNEDELYSSNSSVIDEDFEPNFNVKKTKKVKKSPSIKINDHKCHLLNSNGKECLKEFSRPYDLIRHQETIHAERKKIFRCVVCNKLEGGLSKKTFSRGDALSRHVRVKHGLSGEEAADAVKFAKDHVEYL